MSYIKLENVCIDFPILDSKSRSLRNDLMQKVIGGRLSKSNKTISVRALENVTLNFNKGDRVGLIGHNGAGKTTLLRAIAGVYPPSAGHMEHSGKIASLFDISLGFDLESSGYENILLRGLFSGLSKSDILHSMDNISNFTGLGNFLQMPLRTYSSGMLMRLAFAVATEIQPDIILMDEWIGVGDSSFLDQATKRLETFIDQSSILVLASHSEDLIRKTCNKAVLMGQGQVLKEGLVDDVFDHYNFFGSSSFFDMEEYINLHPDLKNSMSIPGMAPWMHFIKYGIFEGRSPGLGIEIEAFSSDKIFNHAIKIGDGLSAAERIEQIAPFLQCFKPPSNWRDRVNIPYPTDFTVTEGYPLIASEDKK